MEIVKKLLLIALFLFVGTGAVEAQDFFYRKNLANIRVDNLTQDQVIKFQRQIQQSNMSEQEVANYLIGKGLSRDEVAKLKKRMGSLSGAAGGGSVAGDFELLDQYFRLRDSLQMLKQDSLFSGKGKNRSYLQQKEVADSVIFGSELFANAKLSFISDVQLATPDNYIVGPRDVITMTLYGSQESSLELKVQPDGKVNVPYAGVMPLAGLTIEQATERMRQSLIKNGYSTLSSGETKLMLTIAEFRSIQVTVIGARNSGNYVVPSIASVFHVLHLAGGPNKRGTYREIEVIRKGKVVQRIDLYKFLVLGDSRENVNLKEHDVINIPIYANRVMVKGEVKRPGLFELLPGETLDTLLAYAGGFNPLAYKERVYVEQVAENEFTTRDIERSGYPDFVPSSGDVVFVGSILNRYSNRIAIAGAINRPGYYGWEEGMPLASLIQKAGGLRENALMTRGLIYRASKDNSKAYLRFVPQEVMDGSSALILQDGDSVVIGDKSVLFPNEFVRVVGEVRKEGELIFGDGMTVMDAILLSGGLKRSALPNRVEVARRKDGTGEMEIARILDAATDEALAMLANEVGLEAGDIVLVRPNPAYKNQRIVTLSGEFNYPGPYVLLKQKETLSSFIGRSGGLTALADARSAYIVRETKNDLFLKGMREEKAKLTKKDTDKVDAAAFEFMPQDSINLDTIVVDLIAALKRKNGKYDINLQEGDKVVVPVNQNTVSVRGEVNARITVNYSGQRLRPYLSDAGGMSRYADKKRVYVVESNGLARRTHSFLWMRKYPKVMPGSVVVVPSKKRDNDEVRDPARLAATSSIIASTTGLLFIIITTMR